MPAAPASPWPPALAGTPAIAVIERAIEGRRLGHSLLLHGEDLGLLTAVAEAIADRLLRQGAPAAFPVGQHPDAFALRPSGKMRVITAEATRELIAKVQVTPAVAQTKVAIVHEAERMNAPAANIFLKTLEEPPAHTILLLLTTHPYALLPTILSRCLHFKFSAVRGELSPEAQRARADPASAEAAWLGWLGDYQAWLGRISQGTPDKRAAADHILSLYGLAARFGFILERGAAEAWERQKASLPAELEEDEQIAIESGLSAGLRARFFAEIEGATRAFARPRLGEDGEGAASRAFIAAVRKLEHDARLLRLNLNESAALEDFLLSSLRLWSRR
ncbi:MAG TPA: DNA polymerase III subunit gamma/tau [Opitutaceae bacterium]|nr:DNA polymerase III subunit gamma/tau [Opitutaceae bacterium]